MNAVASPRLSPTARGRAVWLALGLAMLLYAGLEFWLTRGTTLFIDEVAMFQQDSGLHPSALLAPFNEHLELARRLLYAVDFRLFGAGTSFTLAKVWQALGCLLLATVFFSFLRRRVGAIAALPASVLLLFFGSGWELNFAISGIGNVYALVCGIGALLALEHRGRRTDALACVLLVVSVVSFSTGLAFAVGALCLLLVAPENRRRAWVAIVPLAVYAAWLLWVRLVYVPANGEVQHITLANVLLIPNVIAQQAASTAGALAGLNYNFEPNDVFNGVFTTGSVYGGVLAAVAAGALAWSLRKGSTPMLSGLLALLAAYWIELALGSGIGRTPSTVRYAYAGAAIWMLIAAEARRRPMSGRAELIVLYGVAAIALLGNLARLRDGMSFYRAFGTAERAQLSAIETAQAAEQPQFKTLLGKPQFAPVTAGPYLAAVRRNGSPAYSQQELARQPASVRRSADAVLVAALGIAPARAPGPVGARCLTQSQVTGTSAGLVIRPPGVTLRSSAPAQLTIGQFSDGVSIGALPAGTAVQLRIPRDRSDRPWQLRLSPDQGELMICPVPSSG